MQLSPTRWRYCYISVVNDTGNFSVSKWFSQDKFLKNPNITTVAYHWLFIQEIVFYIGCCFAYDLTILIFELLFLRYGINLDNLFYILLQFGWFFLKNIDMNTDILWQFLTQRWPQCLYIHTELHHYRPMVSSLVPKE